MRKKAVSIRKSLTAVAVQVTIVALSGAVLVWTDTSTPSAATTPSKAFVSVTGPCCGHGTVVEASPVDGTVGATINVGGTPTGIAVTPDAATVLVANRYGYVSVIDTATYALGPPIPVCSAASAIAITPNGGVALVTCANDSTVEPIDLRTRTVGDPIVVGRNSSQPGAIVIAPDGKTAYAVDFNGADGTGWSGAIVPISLTTETAGAPIILTDVQATSAAVTPDGRRLLVTLGGTTTSGSSVDVIDTTTLAITARVPTPEAANSIAITPDGTTAYVACRYNGVLFGFSLNSAFTTVARIGTPTVGVAVTPDGATLLSAGQGGLELWGTADLHLIGSALTDYGAVAVAVTPSGPAPPPPAPTTALAIQAPSAGVVYGQGVPSAFTPTYVGLTGGDTRPARLPTCTTTAGPAADAGTYPITCAGAFDAKYTITYGSATLTIARAPTALAASSIRDTRLHPTARLTRPDTGAPLAAQAVVFSVDSSAVCTAQTDANGVADCSQTLVVRHEGFTASYRGTANFVASSAVGAF